MEKLNDARSEMDEKLKAAYALNMCTVSVAQIVDYNDVYILEQEYDTILNNLNLEQMPKDEALLTILTELLNIITFFRIHEMKKDMIEKSYQRRIKNAIWSAVPNIGLIVAGGSPVTMAISIASQVGIGYMNYRREKADAAFDKEKEALELQITAIEQFNAIKRELFTTAWRLADTYDFPDQYRLTEKQIKQYNAILMDRDELRKYERLEAIQDNFQAYPPFWYFLGHAANFIAGSKDLTLSDATRQMYRELAKKHFETYAALNKFNILREDQITASCFLEYIDLLLLEPTPDVQKINSLLQDAVKMCGNANDVLQLCALTYIKIGQLNQAEQLLRILVNEEYNTITNAQLLSRIYVACFLKAPSDPIRAKYDILCSRVCPSYLFPMPAELQEDHQLQASFLAERRSVVQREYRHAINLFIKKYTIKANRLLSVPVEQGPDSYYANDPEARKKREHDAEKALESADRNIYVSRMSKLGFRIKYLDLLNEMLQGLNTLTIFSEHPDKADLVRVLKANVFKKQKAMKTFQEKMDSGEFSFADYKSLQQLMYFYDFVKDFTDQLKNYAMAQVDQADSLAILEKMDFEITGFCLEQGIELPQIDSATAEKPAEETSASDYLKYNLLGPGAIADTDRQNQFEKMLSLAKAAAPEIVKAAEDVAFYVRDDAGFTAYFKNAALSSTDMQDDVIAVLDDLTKKDFDLFLTREGLVVVKRNAVQSVREYGRISYAKYTNREVLQLGWPDTYSKSSVNISRLYKLIEEFEEVLVESK